MNGQTRCKINQNINCLRDVYIPRKRIECEATYQRWRYASVHDVWHDALSIRRRIHRALLRIFTRSCHGSQCRGTLTQSPQLSYTTSFTSRSLKRLPIGERDSSWNASSVSQIYVYVLPRMRFLFNSAVRLHKNSHFSHLLLVRSSVNLIHRHSIGSSDSINQFSESIREGESYCNIVIFQSRMIW